MIGEVKLSDLPKIQAMIPAIYAFKCVIVFSMKKLGFQNKLADSLKEKVLDDPNFFTATANILNFSMTTEKIELSVSKQSPKDRETIYNTFENIWINSLKEIFMNPNNKSFFEYIDSYKYGELMDLFKHYPDMINNVIKNAFPVLDITPYDPNNDNISLKEKQYKFNYYEFEIQLY